ncbi:AB-hydrolase YheT [Daedalea quercina L-15889]|uniref:AB-hydrolase YheT n=1 Tax=Daedalea quercina L-15889 TaxID=1314783 RepID=A0A165N336_9APHY|nr:AB-hydrolase YheT [Daedalea quercina L-15889]
MDAFKARISVSHSETMGLLLSLIYGAAHFIPRVYYGSSDSSLDVKAAKDSVKTCRESMRTFIETRCPSILNKYIPAWWLFSGHLQVAYCAFGDFSDVDLMEYDRTLLRTIDGGTIGLDFSPPESARNLREDTPIVIVLHGLTGGSSESYVRAVLYPICAPEIQGGLGYRGVVVMFRGCAGVPLTSPQLYCAGNTDDIRMAVYYIRKKYPRAPLIGVGFSIGANILARYLAEEGEDSRMIAGCTLCSPSNVAENSDLLEGSWFCRTVYSTALGQNMQDIVKMHAERLNTFDHPIRKAVLATLSLSRPTMWVFDDHMTRLFGGPSPPFPMRTVREYYEWSSSHKMLSKIRVPFLAFHDEDDPIVQAQPAYDLGGSAMVAIVVTKKGGHLGWFQSAGGFRVTRWTTKPVIEWVRAVAEGIVPRFPERRSLREVDGFITEAGREDIGCFALEEKVLIDPCPECESSSRLSS